MFEPTFERGPDFNRARSQIATPFQYIDVDLTTAKSNEIFNISGDFLYVDASSSGSATLELNNQYTDPSAPFQIAAGFGINALFKQVKLTWTAQPGKRLRLMYSTGDRVVPTNSTSVNGTVTVNMSGYSYGAVYKSATALAANTPEVVFLPGANVNGVILWSADYLSDVTGNVSHRGAYVAKNAAPASNIDGVVLPMNRAISLGALTVETGCLDQPVRIPAGLGLYYIAPVAQPAALRSALYTLL